MIQIFGHAKCKGTRAAQRFFAERRVKVQMIDVTDKGMSKGELGSVVKAVGIKALYDGDGARAKERGLVHLGPDAARMEQLILEDARLLRTPVVRNGQKATVGVDEPTWKAWAAEAKASPLRTLAPAQVASTSAIAFARRGTSRVATEHSATRSVLPSGTTNMPLSRSAAAWRCASGLSTVTKKPPSYRG